MSDRNKNANAAYIQRARAANRRKTADYQLDRFDPNMGTFEDPGIDMNPKMPRGPQPPEQEGLDLPEPPSPSFNEPSAKRKKLK